jgi:hypothetical protein
MSILKIRMVVSRSARRAEVPAGHLFVCDLEFVIWDFPRRGLTLSAGFYSDSTPKERKFQITNHKFQTRVPGV